MFMWYQFSIDMPFCRFELGLKLSKHITGVRSSIMQNCLRAFAICMVIISGAIFIKIAEMGAAVFRQSLTDKEC